MTLGDPVCPVHGMTRCGCGQYKKAYPIEESLRGALEALIKKWNAVGHNLANKQPEFADGVGVVLNDLDQILEKHK